MPKLCICFESQNYFRKIFRFPSLLSVLNLDFLRKYAFISRDGEETRRRVLLYFTSTLLTCTSPPFLHFSETFRIFAGEYCVCENNTMAKKKAYTVLDLFCGCGGMSLGFEQAGFNVLLGIDIWRDALLTFEHNHKGVKTMCADLSQLSAKQVADKIEAKTVDVIIGGPPCQGFSIAGKRIVDDDRNRLYKSFVRMVEYFRPKAFVMENVPNILTMGNGIIRESIVGDFSKIGYSVVHKVLLAADYGVPQNRRRAIFVGMLNYRTFEFPNPTVKDVITCKDAISDLPECSLPEGSPYPTPAQSEFQFLMRRGCTAVYNHEITEHSDKTKAIIAMVPDGGNYKDLPLDLQMTRKVHIAWTRLNSSRPSITIDTGHFHHFHYLYNRVPSARESARIQSFPDSFVFIGNKTSKLKQIGNAVPPIMAQVLAQSLNKQL